MATVLLAAAVGLLLGCALGLFGGGGGILAVPMLVGLLGMDVDGAATASLLIVLFGALGGLVSHQRAGRVMWRSGLIFGSVSVVGAVLGAVMATRVADWIKLSGFTALMVVAGLAMLRNARSQPTVGEPCPSLVGGPSRASEIPPAEATPQHGTARGPGEHGVPGPAMDPPVPTDAGADGPGPMLDAPDPDLQILRPRASVAGRPSILALMALATGTGLVTGFLGVGGGFLVVPALVLSLRIPMANATATGLVVIGFASASALAVRVQHADALVEPALTSVIVMATLLASLAAARFSSRVSPRVLGTGFGVLVLAMSVLVAAQAAEALRAALAR